MGMVLIPNVSRSLFRILAALLWLAFVLGITAGYSSTTLIGVAAFTALLGARDWLLRILHARPAFIPL